MRKAREASIVALGCQTRRLDLGYTDGYGASGSTARIDWDKNHCAPSHPPLGGKLSPA